MKKTPRGVRNHNPGNIRWGDKWQGMVTPFERHDPDFCQFIDPTWGIRALARVLITYQDKHGLNTIAKIIARWAPPNENNTPAYVEAVAAATGIPSSEPLDLHRYEAMRPIVEAIIRHECGKGELRNVNSWYSSDVIDTGLRLAGIVKPPATVAKVPVTKETLGASATATLGIAQIAEVMPSILAAMDKSESHITSGSVIRVVFGVATIAVAVSIAWSQVKKYKQGLAA